MIGPILFEIKAPLTMMRLQFEVGARISDVDKAVIRDYVKTELHKQGLLD